MEKIKTEVENIFKLPFEEKKKFWQTPGVVEGFGQAFVASEDQKLDWNDVFIITTQPVQIRKPHLLPKLPPSFRLINLLYTYIHIYMRNTIVDSISYFVIYLYNILIYIYVCIYIRLSQ